MANCWPGRSSWPDYFNPTVRSWWESLHQYDRWKYAAPNFYLWNDMNEISVFDAPDKTAPKDLKHYQDIEEREVHNAYGHMMISSTYRALVQKDNKRPFILTRSFFAGSQKYAVLWTGDNAANWEHLANSIPMCLSNSIAGMIYIGTDIGGFYDTPSPELLTRWYQLGAWCFSFFRCLCTI